MIAEITEIVIVLPIPPLALRPNSRSHWRNKAKVTKKCRTLAGILCKVALAGRKPPMWDKATVQLDARFRTWQALDPDNLVSSCKAYFDGIQDAGIVWNDARLWPLRATIATKSDAPGLTMTIRPDAKSPAKKTMNLQKPSVPALG